MTVDGTSIAGLHMSFDIVKTRGTEPNTAKITVYNLNAESRRVISEATRPEIVLTAGYEGSDALVFSGRTRRAISTKNGVDWMTTFNVGDGADAARLPVAIKFPTGTSVIDAVKQIAEQTGLVSGDLVSRLRSKSLLVELVDGFTAVGNAADLIKDLCKSNGVTPTIQDGAWTGTGKGEVNTGKEPYVLRDDTGMLGTPEYGDKGNIHVKTLLLPDLRPNDPVRMDTLEIKGNYRVDRVQHSGEWRGATWQSTLDLSPV